MATTLLNPIWISLTCHTCGESFSSIDPSRKWCDAHLVERVNGAGILEDDDEQDDLFAERTLVCQGCGATFTTTNPRAADRCAECRSGLKIKVVCPVCDLPHVVALLAPHKLCLSCTADMEMTLAYARNRYDDAVSDANAASSTLIDDCNRADAETRRRYEAAVELRQTGQMNGATYNQVQRTAAWQKALTRGDSLSPLLAGYDVWHAAQQALERAQAALVAIEEATNG